MEIICHNCEINSQVQPVRDSIIIEDKFLGKITTRETEILMCENCNEFLITEEISRLIEDKIDKQRDLLIKALPFSKFISVKKVSEILSISRQAIHKNSYLKRIVYNSKIDKQLFFVKKSVEQYKITGDGRFNLSQKDNYKDSNIYLLSRKNKNLESLISEQESFSLYSEQIELPESYIKNQHRKITFNA